MISVVFLSSHRFDLTARCLKSLTVAVARAWPNSNVTELLIGFQDSDRKSALEELVRDLNFDRSKLVPLPVGPSVPQLRNQLLKMRNSGCHWVLFIDDDIELPPDYFVQFERLQKTWPKGQVFGGPNLTPPYQDGLALYSGKVLGSWLNFICRERYSLAAEGPRKSARDFILCNLIVHNEAALEFFPELPFGEELGLLDHLLKTDHDCIYSPNLHIFHFRRECLGTILQQMEKYGLGRGLSFARSPHLLSGEEFSALIALVGSCLLAAPLAAIAFFAKNRNSNQDSFLNRMYFLSLTPWFYMKGLLIGLWRHKQYSNSQYLARHAQAR